jgi:nucleoid-associated protein EbfC
MKLNRSREWSSNKVADNEVYFLRLMANGPQRRIVSRVIIVANGRETIAIGVFAEGPGEELFAKSPSPDPLPQGGFIVFGLKDLIQQAQGLQSKVAALQEELAEKVVVGSSGGDMVKVEASGAQEILSITIEKELLDPEDPEMLQDLIVAAVNDALKKSRELMAQEMSKLTGGLPIPGLTV